MRSRAKLSEPASDLVRVRFVVDDTPYKAGEVHELDEAQAEKMIRHKVAVAEE